MVDRRTRSRRCSASDRRAARLASASMLTLRPTRSQCHWSPELPSARGECPQREEECHHRSSSEPDLFLPTAQPLADHHCDGQAEQSRCAVEPVNQLLRPIARCHQNESDQHLHSDQRNLDAEIDTDGGQHARAKKTGYRRERANRRDNHQYETVPIMEEHAAMVVASGTTEGMCAGDACSQSDAQRPNHAATGQRSHSCVAQVPRFRRRQALPPSMDHDTHSRLTLHRLNGGSR
jgi:hypothetical protein